ncbi:MAG: secondary thiamine-phosphate synthase enzyme YjbQ [Candidatus Pacearchaeota archaeon]
MQLTIKTKKREELIDITKEIEVLISKSKIKEGLCFLFVPHATAGLTINENADPNVKQDILNFLSKLVPQGKWSHDQVDRNADAHIKSSLIGSSVVVPIQNGKLQLGTWQGIMFCEFDGPRERKVILTCIER